MPSSENYTWSYEPYHITSTSEGLTTRYVDLDTISSVESLYPSKSEVKEMIREELKAKPIYDKLDEIIARLKDLDKKYLNNAMRNELDDMLEEIAKYREEDNNG